MNKFYAFFLLLLVSPFFVFCGNCCEQKGFALTEEQTEFVEKGNHFAFEFLKKVNQETAGEYMVSPLSLQFLLSMVLNGAQGTSADEILDVLGYEKGETDKINDYCALMLNQLPKVDSLTKLNIANALVVNEKYPLLKSYNKKVKSVYEAEISQLDFTQKEEVLARVNGWCNEKSEGLIPKIMDDVEPGMMAVLMNAVYFKSSWTTPFNKKATTESDFTSEDGSKKSVPMMQKTEQLPYWENEDFQMVQLPYSKGSFSMTVLLPKEGEKVADIIDELDEENWNEWRQSCTNKKVRLALPRFESKFHIDLNKILSDMGMPSIFTANADLGAMFRSPAYMSVIQQDSAIKIDEEGSEAAAITSGMVRAMAARPEETIDFTADHSFLYLITENTTGTVLFAGKY
jgi:serpin B